MQPRIFPVVCTHTCLNLKKEKLESNLRKKNQHISFNVVPQFTNFTTLSFNYVFNSYLATLAV